MLQSLHLSSAMHAFTRMYKVTFLLPIGARDFAHPRSPHVAVRFQGEGLLITGNARRASEDQPSLLKKSSLKAGHMSFFPGRVLLAAPLPRVTSGPRLSPACSDTPLIRMMCREDDKHLDDLFAFSPAQVRMQHWGLVHPSDNDTCPSRIDKSSTVQWIVLA